MSLSSGFFNAIDHDRLYNADEMSRLFDGLIRDGVFASIGTCFVVTQNTGMTVSVGIGRAWFDHTWTLNDAILPVEIGQSEMLVPRIDAIVIEVNHEEAVRQNSIKVIKGTPGTNPAKPTLTKTDLVKQYPLCYVTVGAAVEQIRQADIENTVGTTECPFVTGILEVISIEQLIPQWKDILNKFVEDNTKSFNEWMTTEKTSYAAWLQANKDSQAQFEKDRDAEYAEWFDGVKDSYSSWFATIKEAYDVNWETFQKWESDSKDEFETWFDTIKEQLSDDVAGKLALRDEQLQADKVGLIKMGYNADSECYYAKDTVDGKLMIANAPAREESYDIVCCGPKLLTEDIYNLPHAEYKGATCEKLPTKEVRNLIPFPYHSSSGITTNGITFTVNDDGTIIANGTATGETAYFNLTNHVIGSWNTLPAGTYKILDGYTGDTKCRILLQLNSTTGVRHGNSEFTITKDCTYKIFIAIVSGTTCNNVIFKPMLTEDTTVTADDYVKYSEDPVLLPNRVKVTFGSEADSGAYFDLSKKINLKSDGKYTLACTLDVSKEMTSNKNNFVSKLTVNATRNGVTCMVNDDGTYTVNGTNTSRAAIAFNLAIKEYFSPGQWALTGCPTGGGINKYDLRVIDNTNDNVLLARATNGDTVTFEIPTPGIYIQVQIYIYAGAELNNCIFKPMITNDLTATYDDFEPYGGAEVQIGVEGATFNECIGSVSRGKNAYEFDFDYDGQGKLNFVCYSKKADYSGETIAISDMVLTKLGSESDTGKYADNASFEITSSTEFPLIVDKAFDGETTVFAPDGCEIYYPDGQNGIALLDSIYQAANSGGIAYSDTAPKNPKVGDIWIDAATAGANGIINVYTGSEWLRPFAYDINGGDVLMQSSKPNRARQTLWIDTANNNTLKHVAANNGTVTELVSGGISVGTSAPSNTKLLWIDTGNGGVTKYWDGSAWTPTKAVWG